MHFTTSFGDKIDVTPGYRNLFPHRQSSLNVAAELASRINESGGEVIKDQYPLISYKGYAARLARTSRMLQFLHDAELAGPYRSMLDLGTGHGLQPMLLKGFGVANEARGIDLVKREGSSTPGHLKKRHWQLKLSGPILDKLYAKAMANPKFPFNEALNNGIRKYGSPRNWGKQAVGDLMSPEFFYNLKFKNTPELDEYLEEDLYAHTGKYDLITAFSALMLFPTEKTIAKIADMLEEGGVLSVLDPYWWYPATGFPFVGDFPWAGQRLTPEDYIRYVEEFHPEDADQYKAAKDYFVFPQPTLRTYEELGKKYGLHLVAYKRFIPAGSDLNRGPSALIQNNWNEGVVDEVLENISRFRDDVTRDDLFTSFIAFAMVKRSTPPTQEEYEQQIKEADKPKAGSDSPVFKLLKNAVLKVTNR